jgi:hypothetical protein
VLCSFLPLLPTSMPLRSPLPLTFRTPSWMEVVISMIPCQIIGDYAVFHFVLSTLNASVPVNPALL